MPQVKRCVDIKIHKDLSPGTVSTSLGGWWLLNSWPPLDMPLTRLAKKNIPNQGLSHSECSDHGYVLEGLSNSVAPALVLVGEVSVAPLEHRQHWWWFSCPALFLKKALLGTGGSCPVSGLAGRTVAMWLHHKSRATFTGLLHRLFWKESDSGEKQSSDIRSHFYSQAVSPRRIMLAEL